MAGEVPSSRRRGAAPPAVEGRDGGRGEADVRLVLSTLGSLCEERGERGDRQLRSPGSLGLPRLMPWVSAESMALSATARRRQLLLLAARSECWPPRLLLLTVDVAGRALPTPPATPPAMPVRLSEGMAGWETGGRGGAAGASPTSSTVAVQWSASPSRAATVSFSISCSLSGLEGISNESLDLGLVFVELCWEKTRPDAVGGC